MHRYLCPTPQGSCTGALVATNNGLSKAHKTHTSSEDAFRCYVRHLLANGYTRMDDSRSFRMPGGGVLVLDKKSRFGAELRPGKSAEGVRGKRFRPKKGSGVII